jgi:hypothetical protein
MSYPINYPTPQGADVQIFRQGGTTSSWVKPQGASFVWFTLIGPGGGGAGWNPGVTDGGGGGSGAVTNFMGPAFLMPDVLSVFVGVGGAAGNSSNGFVGTATTVTYQQKAGSGYTLLTASSGLGGTTGGTGGSGGAASTSNYFTAMGFFQSVAGQAGATGSANISASTTTFLSGGSSGGSNGSLTANYGYGNTSGGNKAGFFMFQPIIVGVGGNRCSLGNVNAVITGTGCGGSGGSGSVIGSRGGDGLVVIITW